MEKIKIIDYFKEDLSESLLVCAFPTVGLISSIAGHYIIDTLKLKEIGAFISSDFTPVAIIHKSKPSPPVRIYSGNKKCGPDGECEQITVIISEFMPPYKVIKPLADEILKWAADKKCKHIVSLEGTHAIGDKKYHKVYGVASNNNAKKFLKKYNIEETKDGMITGVSGCILYESVLKNQDVICLLSEAHSSYPDSRAAGNLLKKLDIMLPMIDINPKPLYDEAEKIENQIKKFMEQSKPTAPQLPPLPATMYG